MKILFSLLLCSVAFGQEVNLDHQLLWEITGKGSTKKSYLYGSFHTNDKRVFKWSDSTYTALRNAEAIVLETDIYEMFEDWDTRKDDVHFSYDEDGNPYTPDRNAGKTMYGDEDGMPQFLDAYFMQYCYNSGKSFFGLETLDDQLSLLDGRMDYAPSFNALEAMMVSQERILKLYLDGDINGLDKLMRAGLAVYPDLYEDLIVGRNYTMADGIDTLAQEHRLFIAVGAGHLAGEEGIINLLRKKGYRVRRVQYTYSEQPTDDRKAVLSYKDYKFKDTLLGLNAIFPGKPLEINDPERTRQLIYREMGQGNTYSIEIVEKYEGANLERFAMDYIQTPENNKINYDVLDDGTLYAQGLSDTYPEGLNWIRIIEGRDVMVIMKVYGGNKFMNSNRPESFFNRVWFDF